ncbi:MAG TPA: AMP-binding protein, partial [Aquihabitans sp.]|nr:AMP-binding protein [Aquihabitans sp.]
MTAEPADWRAHLPTGVDPATVDLLAERSLPAAWAARWADHAAAPTVHDRRSGWTTAGELEARSAGAAARFHAAGALPGDRILISAASSLALVVAHVAALRLGLVVVPANTAYRERELVHLVTDARPTLAVVDDPTCARWVVDADDRVVATGPDLDLLPAGREHPLLDRSAPDDPALLAYTSGTTGSPKGALLSHGNLLSSAEALRIAWRWTPDDRLVLPLPLFHLHGLGVGLHGTLLAGAGVVLHEAFDPGRVVDAVRDERATLLFGVPTLWQRLLASGRAGELDGLRLGVSGSAPLDAQLHRAIAEATGQRLIERYGMTETVMNVSNPYDGERRPGTVGIPLPHVSLRLAPGTGEILLRGPNVFAGYWERPDATADSFVDRWFATGDVGAIDDDGYVRIVGRRKELIISGGYNVYPREVEDVLRRHPSVSDVAVIGLPHPD